MQHRFVVARAVLRRSLMAYLRTDPCGTEFAYGCSGKPHLAGQHAGAGQCINSSHPEGRALMAVGRTPLGIDLERRRPLCDSQALAARYFAPNQRLTVQALPTGQKRETFLACWTREEASIKALAAGLFRSLKSFKVVFAPGSKRAVLAPGCGPSPGRSLSDLEPERGFLGALAVFGSDCAGRRLEPPRPLARERRTVSQTERSA